MLQTILSLRFALGYLLLGLYIALTAFMLARFFRTALSPASQDIAPQRATWKTVLLHTALAFCLSRGLIIAVLMVCYYRGNGYLTDFLPALPRLLHHWDAGQYLPLIEHGYLSEGDEALRIVFFPLYPMVCQMLRLATGFSANACALSVSNLCCFGCGIMLWRLSEEEGDQAFAQRVMLLFFFFPVSFFFSMAYSESLFLLTSLMAVYAARKRKFFWAVLFGALCANTRLLGLAIAIPIYWEMLRADGRRPMPRILLCTVKALPVALGFLAYLLLNQRLFGDMFRFMTYERENWGQRFGTLSNTFQYTLNNALTYGKMNYRLGTWVPQLIALLSVPALVAAQSNKRRAGDLAYQLVYHYIAFAPTWLLSGVRYAAGSFALYLMLAGLAEGRRRFAVMLVIEIATMVYMTALGLWVGVVL